MIDKLPSGTVTFLFTDIEGSTKLAQEHPDTWESLRGRHHAILKSAIGTYNGYVFQIIGDSFCAGFHTAGDAVRAAIKAQFDLEAEDWGKASIKVRMAIHTGKAEVQENGEYLGYLTMSRVQRLMTAAHGGQVLISLATQELIRDEMPNGVELYDMGERRLRDLIRPEHIFQLAIPHLRSAFPPIKTLDAYRHNIPAQTTSFIGREKEMVEVKRALNEYRLVTLTGSGGTGKTRLSLQVAADLLDHFQDGVWFIELAPLTEPNLIPQTVLSVFGIGEQSGKTALQSLVEYLREKKILLVLDNCEHLITASAELVDALLSHSPALKILASSREALGVRGEMMWHVPSLSLPNIKQLPSIEQLSQYEAVSLFIERATLAQPHFNVTRDNAPAIAQICFRLDGIPLAIELAAARVKTLSVNQIASRLDDRFRLLTGGARTALPRQQTLSALIDWSYNLLSPKEKILFCRLAVFIGGWGLEAAEAICQSEDLEQYEILDLLTHLVDKSLILVDETHGEVRYHRLETIRQYAREKLLETDNVEAVRGRHYNWFLHFIEEAEPKLVEAESSTWLDRIEVEYDNLRSALEWSLRKDGGTSIRLAAALGRFWQLRGYWSEGREMLRRALEADCEAAPGWRANGLKWAASLASKQANYQQAIVLAKESLHLYQSLAEEDGTSGCLTILGIATWSQGDYAAARRYSEEALIMRRKLGNKPGVATSLTNLGLIAWSQGDYPAARSYQEESIAMFRELKDPRGLAVSLNNLGTVEEAQGNYQAAQQAYEEGLVAARELNDKDITGYTLNSLGHLLLLQGNLPAAQRSFRESLVVFKEVGEKRGLAYCFEGLALVNVALGKARQATRFLAAAEALRELIGAPLTAKERAECDEAIRVAQTQLENEVFESAWSEGKSMILEQAISDALGESDA